MLYCSTSCLLRAAKKFSSLSSCVHIEKIFFFIDSCWLFTRAMYADQCGSHKISVDLVLGWLSTEAYCTPNNIISVELKSFNISISQELSDQQKKQQDLAISNACDTVCSVSIHKYLVLHPVCNSENLDIDLNCVEYNRGGLHQGVVPYV